MSAEGLTREMANIQGQRTAGIGRAITGAIGTGVQGLQDFSRVRDEDIMQQQLKKGKQGVLDMAKAENLDANQMNILNSMMAGPLNKDVLGKMAVYIQGVKDANEKKAAGVAQEDKVKGIIDPLRTSTAAQGMALPGESLEESLSRGETEGFDVAKTKAAEGIRSGADLDIFTKGVKAFEPKDPSGKDGLTANQKRLLNKSENSQEEKIKKRFFKDFDQIGTINATIDGLVSNNEVKIDGESFRKVKGLDPLSSILPAGAKTILAEFGLKESEWTEQVNQNRRIMNQFIAEYVRSMSGLAVTDKERKNLEKNLAAGTFTSSKEFENAFNQIVRTAKEKMKRREKAEMRSTTRKLFNNMFPEGERPSQQLRFLDLGVELGKSKDVPETLKETPKPKAAKVDASMSIEEMLSTLPEG